MAIALLGFSNTSLGQFSTIDFDNGPVYLNNTAYVSATVSNYDCDSVILTSKQGTFEKFKNCLYHFKPSTVGDARISIYYIQDGDTILTGIRVFEILLPPSPKAHILEKTDGLVNKDFFMNALKINGSYFITSKRWNACEVISYQVIISRNNNIIFCHYNQGTSFEEKAMTAFKNLKSNDRVSFINIKGCEEKGGEYLNNLGFTIE